MSLQAFIEQIVNEVAAGAGKLAPQQQQSFLTWLGDHAKAMRSATLDDLSEKLSTWLSGFDPVGILWEYRLLLSEIEWWAGEEAL